jgi:hypothetical protein
MSSQEYKIICKLELNMTSQEVKFLYFIYRVLAKYIFEVPPTTPECVHKTKIYFLMSVCKENEHKANQNCLTKKNINMFVDKTQCYLEEMQDIFSND